MNENMSADRNENRIENISANANETANVSLEAHFKQIEEIIDQMETKEVSLDQSFALYKSGLEEIKAAASILDDMEKAMLVLNDDGSLEEF